MSTTNSPIYVNTNPPKPMQYKVVRSYYNGQYNVINSVTGLAQSSWSDKNEAARVAKDLNRPWFEGCK